MTTILAGVAALGLSTAAGASEVPEPFTSTQLSDRLHVIYGGRGFGAHVGVCEGEDGLLVIDSMLERSADQLESAIRSISDKPIHLVINTHAHSDHTGGNAMFVQQGASIIGHSASMYSPSPAQVRVDGGFELDYCGERISATPVIAHTYGDLLIHFESSDAVFVGDVFTNTYYSSGYAKGLRSERDSIAAVQSLAGPSTRIVPGHGFIDDVHGLQRYLGLVEEWFTRIGELHATGMPLAEMLADERLRVLDGRFLKYAAPREDAAQRLARYVQRSIAAEYVEPVALGRFEAEAIAGRYSSDGQADFFVEASAGEVLLYQAGSFMEELIPLGGGKFHLRGGIDTYVTFVFDANRAVQSLTLHFGGDSLTAVKQD